MERVGGRQEEMEGHFSTGQSPQWAVVSMEEEEFIDRFYQADIIKQGEVVGHAARVNENRNADKVFIKATWNKELYMGG